MMRKLKRHCSLEDCDSHPLSKQRRIDNFFSLTQKEAIYNFNIPTSNKFEILRTRTEESPSPLSKSVDSPKMVNPPSELSDAGGTSNFLAEQTSLIASTVHLIFKRLDQIMVKLGELTTLSDSSEIRLDSSVAPNEKGGKYNSKSANQGKYLDICKQSNLILQPSQVALTITPRKGVIPFWGSKRLVAQHLSHIFKVSKSRIDLTEVYRIQSTNYMKKYVLTFKTSTFPSLILKRKLLLYSFGLIPSRVFLDILKKPLLIYNRVNPPTTSLGKVKARLLTGEEKTPPKVSTYRNIPIVNSTNCCCSNPKIVLTHEGDISQKQPIKIADYTTVSTELKLLTSSAALPYNEEKAIPSQLLGVLDAQQTSGMNEEQNFLRQKEISPSGIQANSRLDSLEISVDEEIGELSPSIQKYSSLEDRDEPPAPEVVEPESLLNTYTLKEDSNNYSCDPRIPNITKNFLFQTGNDKLTQSADLQSIREISPQCIINRAANTGNFIPVDSNSQSPPPQVTEFVKPQLENKLHNSWLRYRFLKPSELGSQPPTTSNPGKPNWVITPKNNGSIFLDMKGELEVMEPLIHPIQSPRLPH